MQQDMAAPRSGLACLCFQYGCPQGNLRYRQVHSGAACARTLTTIMPSSIDCTMPATCTGSSGASCRSARLGRGMAPTSSCSARCAPSALSAWCRCDTARGQQSAISCSTCAANCVQSPVCLTLFHLLCLATSSYQQRPNALLATQVAHTIAAAAAISAAIQVSISVHPINHLLDVCVVLNQV